MTRILTYRERQALDRMTIDHASFHAQADLGPDVEMSVIESLLALGLIEAGPIPNSTSWRLTDDGWRCMFGKTFAKIMASGADDPAQPLKVWQWPPA